MSNKVLINLKNGVNLQDFKNGDILMYDAIEKNFYRVTPEVFFDKYEKKLTNLLNNYDKKYAELDEKFQNLDKKNKEFMKQIKDSNTALIDFVKKNNIVEENGGNE